MRRFLLMLLAVLFCTSALCIYDVYADSNTSSNAQTTENESIHDSISNIKSTAINSENDTYSDEEVYLVAQLVHHEAHNQAYNGKVAVAEVILNRVNSVLFPNKVNEVVSQNGQFTNSRRLKNISPTEQELRIAYNVLNGSLRVLNDKNIMYFRNPKITSGISASHKKNWGKLEYATHIGDHAFYSQEEPKDKKESIINKIVNGGGIGKLFTAKNEKNAKEEKTDDVTDAILLSEEASVEENTTEPVADTVMETSLVLEESEAGAVSTLSEEMLALETPGILDGEQPLETQGTIEVTDSTEASNEADVMTNLGTSEKSDIAEISKETEESEATGISDVNNNTIAIANSIDAGDEFDFENYDENDPVAVARYLAYLNEKAERERQERLLEEERLANENARTQAVLLERLAVEKTARQNAEMARATEIAVKQAILMQIQRN